MIMKFSYLAITLSCVLIFSCQNDGKAPISADNFVLILTDMHTAEAAAEGETLNMRDSILKIYYPQILKKHGASQADFDSTLAVYSRRPIEYDSIYARVLREVAKIDTSGH
jgi:Domain of unknown function (DUF4296)